MSERFSTASGFAASILEWIGTLPSWLRPPAFGALFIVLLMGLRGAFVIGPILLILLLFSSQNPMVELGTVAACLGVAVLGGALSGLVYSLVGRSIGRIPLIGPYVAGVITVFPYMVVVAGIVQVADREPLAPFNNESLVIVGIMSLIFGPIIGHFFLRPGAFDAP